MKQVVVKFVKGSELTADKDALFRHVAHDVTLPVHAPQTKREDGPVVMMLDEMGLAHHEPEKVNGHQEKQDSHKTRKPF